MIAPVSSVFVGYIFVSHLNTLHCRILFLGGRGLFCPGCICAFDYIVNWLLGFDLALVLGSGACTDVCIDKSSTGVGFTVDVVVVKHKAFASGVRGSDGDSVTV